jgi:hypothetical protein
LNIYGEIAVEKVEVTAHFDTLGHITPLKFVWNGSTFGIEDTGRRWETKGRRNMLVMITGNQVFHLMFELNSCTWNLVTSHQHPPENQF